MESGQNKNNSHDSNIEEAINSADPYRGQGTSYLHSIQTNSLGSTANLESFSHKDENPTGAVIVPISLATTFKQIIPGIPTAKNDPNSFGMGYEYSRTGNPTRGAFERAMSTAEKSRYCVAFASGSAATSAVIHLLSYGDNVICVDDVYGGTQRYFRRIVSPTMGITFDFLDMNDEDKVRSKLKAQGERGEKIGDRNESNQRRTKLIWIESPTNPTLKISDIRTLADLAHSNGCILAVDNTFCSPYFQSPLELGADIVVHSVTKYINGHSDVVMGVVCTNDEDLYKKLRFTQNGLGAVPSPFDCFLAHRGLKTLHIRMEAAARNAHAIALFLESHKAVTKVLYPGLNSHPQHKLALRQQHGFGAIISFYCAGKREQSLLFLKNLRIFALAESLGAVESLAECPSLMTHASVPDNQRAMLGIDDTLIRLSIGIESCRDLVNDLDSALNVALDSIS